MSLIIESLFTIGGVPTSGLSPSLRIYEIIGATKTLVLGPVAMSDVGDGYYLYDFTTGLGFDETKMYTSHVDGGVSLPPNERYQTQTYTPNTLTNSNISNIADAVWDENMVSHMIPGSTGEGLNLIKADTTQILLDTTQILLFLQELLKYEKNRTRIDLATKQLWVYDNDGTTILRKFQLKDSLGVPSVTEVIERLPIP